MPLPAPNHLPTNQGGRIRFAGGPLHNELLHVAQFQPEIIIIAPDQQLATQDDHLDLAPLWRHRYQLIQFQSTTGCRWLEYEYKKSR